MRAPRGFGSLTVTERFAMQLIAAGLNTPELAAAMSWTVPQTQVFWNKLRSMCSSASRSAAAGKRAISSRR